MKQLLTVGTLFEESGYYYPPIVINSFFTNIHLFLVNGKKLKEIVVNYQKHFRLLQNAVTSVTYAKQW